METDAQERKAAKLVMSNGEVLHGKLMGAPLRCRGELVFTTSLVGYSESLSDPSYFGQILVYAYPLIGNYGVPLAMPSSSLLPLGHESAKVHVAGVIVTVDSPEVFHWNSYASLSAWLKREGIPGMSCVDTRHLIHLIREHCPLYGRMEPEGITEERQYGGIDLPAGEFFDASQYPILGEVSTKRSYSLLANHDSATLADVATLNSVARSIPKAVQAQENIASSVDVAKEKKVAVIDCGVKSNILRSLVAFGCDVEVLPWDSDLSDIVCDGWVISNGPGDPMLACSLIEKVRELLQGDRPILGICLGHQILGIAAGIPSERMRYGHRSHNQPVRLEGSSRGFITSQNHGFHLVEGADWPEDWRVWFRNVNDQSVEGIVHKDLPFRSVQFHPEASGGPRDTMWIIKDFVREL